MKRALGLAAALVVGLAGTVLAGAMYRNDSGAVARAIRIEFSEPAEITSMWPSFSQRDPQGPATVVVLSGGEIASGGWFSFTWRPDAARVVKMEWLASPPSSARPNLGLSEPKERPEVHGGLLNPAFFAHPAYVMQGVSDRDKIFALPLHGVPELSFYPVLGDLPASSLTWTFEVSHPEGIGAAIEDGTLYIWGSNPEWQGYGEVQLHVTAPDGRTSSVTIPVVVFCADRTLVNPQGKKDYFVPWGVILDINRILSVEEHMRQYNKPDLGLLDRTLRFSRWGPMGYLKSVTFSYSWVNEFTFDGAWRAPTSYRLVEVLFEELKDLGVNCVVIPNILYLDSVTGHTILSLHDGWARISNWWGETKTPADLAFMCNEAHRLGMHVGREDFVVPGFPHDTALPFLHELGNCCPNDWSLFLHNLLQHTAVSTSHWTSLGVDIAFTIRQLEGMCDFSLGLDRVEAAYADVIETMRTNYLGPISTNMGLVCSMPFGEGFSSLSFRFYEELDVLTVAINWVDMKPLTLSSRPGLEELDTTP